MAQERAQPSRKRPLNVSDVKPGRRKGRPASGIQWVQLNTNIRPDQLHSLDALADRQTRSRNEVVREALDQYIARSDVGCTQSTKEEHRGQ